MGLVALGDRYAVCKGDGITTSFEPACRAHDFFICSKVQKLVSKIIKQHENAKKHITLYSVHFPRLNKCFFSPGFCLCKHKLIYPSKKFNDLHIALELPRQFSQAHQSADRHPNIQLLILINVEDNQDCAQSANLVPN